ncbi:MULTISPECIES: ribosome hibernation-promoting factor, HPF/YfiA family [Cellulophaga]|jgi:putative sigma-54 modulation protein|uniref:30S ribosomal protein S30 n=1 Tax=Cellulophaga baltica 18 TaxID=1348584 RepID=A0AAU8S3V3_9FLAO|nr:MULTISPECIES: ribosome-associated translation inhibitor RaiA [Cellulophaga]AIZ43860.1 30S ribosomal protein S30 [Cellulophaga baltica 18]KGK30196.1 30S ribosomal protein S30 [Cellulophaga sp. E6(2014)]MCR1024624.1 ribosome-associated translation inhibitor RaiA [Cellulophaga baltica]WFO15991.1 ribosome-associated translation inhibitor RaiA [Cellulophaga baltica 4]
MQIIYEYHDVTSSDRLEAMAKEKLDKLKEKYDMLIRADVFFKEENTSSDETGKICNIRLSLPGPRLFAEASHDNFQSSISETINELERQLRKKKEKMQQH